MTSTEEMQNVLEAARGMIGRMDINFKSRSPAEGLVCIDVFVLSVEKAGIPIGAMMRRLYRQNPSAYPPDSGGPYDVNFARRIRNVIAFLTALGLWHPEGKGLPGQLIVLSEEGRPAHTGVVGRADAGGAVSVIMATSYGGPPLAVREVVLSGYLSAHPEFTIYGFGDPPPVREEKRGMGPKTTQVKEGPPVAAAANEFFSTLRIARYGGFAGPA